MRARLAILLRQIRDSIAFYPTLIAVALTTAALAVLLLEGTDLVHVSSVSNAQQLLGVVIGGVISLMVFSFSTVMLVLSQASSQFSPRVLPGLITQRAHQIILGTELGTVLFSLLVLLSLPESGTPPQWGVLLATALGLVCLVLFVVFIHSVSRSIQLQPILSDRMRAGLAALPAEAGPSGAARPDTRRWTVIESPSSGYVTGRRTEQLLSVCDELDICAEELHWLGDFVLTGAPLVRVSRGLDDAERESLCGCYTFSTTAPQPEGVLRSLRDITEIALKALSPGINDPNSALLAVDFLTLLLDRWMSTYADLSHSSKGTARLFPRRVTLDHLLYRHLGPIATYGQGDGMVLGKLLDCLSGLHRAHPEHPELAALTRSGRLVRDLADQGLRGAEIRRRFDDTLAAFSERVGIQISPIGSIPLT